MAGEIIEQAKLGGGGGNSLPANSENHRGRIDGDVAYLQRTGRQRPLKAAQHGLDAGHKLARAERLSDVVVGSDLEAEHAVRFTAFGSEENHRHGREARSLPDGAAKFKSVLARDHDVEDEQRRALALSIGNYVGAVGIKAHRKAIVLQVMANEAGNIGIVLDDEDRWFHAFIVGEPSC